MTEIKQISANIPLEIYKAGKLSGIKWGTLIKMGIEKINIQHKFNELMIRYEELEKKQRRTAQLLNQYATGGENNVLEPHQTE